MIIRSVLVVLMSAIASFPLNAEYLDSNKSSPLRSDAIIKGKVINIRVGDLIKSALGEDAWVIFSDERDSTIAVSFNGPKWATDTVDDALLESGLQGVWVGKTLIVYSNEKPYIVGQTPRNHKSNEHGPYIVTAGNVVDVFSQVSAEWGKVPMIDNPLLAKAWSFSFALKFEGHSLKEDLDSLRAMVDELAAGEFQVTTDFTKEVSILQLRQVDQPVPVLAEKVKCQRQFDIDKDYRAIKRDMADCENVGITVYSSKTAEEQVRIREHQVIY